MPTKGYSEDIAENYQACYYYINKVGQVILNIVGEDNYGLFLADFENSPHFKKYMQYDAEQLVHDTTHSGDVVQYALTLKQNIEKLFKTLPEHSHFRQQLLSALVTEIPTKAATKIFSIGPKSIQRARNVNFSTTAIATKRYAANTTRQRVSTNEINAVLLIVIELCPTFSGTTLEIYFQLITREKLYTEYCLRLEIYNRTNNTTYRPRAERVFNRIAHILHIRRIRKYWGWAKCPQCHGGNPTPEHLYRRDHQRKQYQDMLANLDTNTVIWTCDFSDIYTPISKGESTKITNFTIVMVIFVCLIHLIISRTGLNLLIMVMVILQDNQRDNMLI